MIIKYNYKEINNNNYSSLILIIQKNIKITNEYLQRFPINVRYLSWYIHNNINNIILNRIIYYVIIKNGFLNSYKI